MQTKTIKQGKVTTGFYHTNPPYMLQGELQSSQDECLGKEIDNEKQVTQLEDDLHKTTAELTTRQRDSDKLNNQIQNMTSERDQLKTQVQEDVYQISLTRGVVRCEGGRSDKEGGRSCVKM